MENKIEQLWLNQEAGFLFRSTSSPDSNGIINCVGKKVVVEGCEFDTVSIDGVYYEIVGNIGGLDLLKLTDYPSQEVLQPRDMGPEVTGMEEVVRVLKRCEDIKRMWEIIEETSGDDPERYNPEVSDTGCLWENLQEEPDVKGTVERFLSGFCGKDCECNTKVELQNWLKEVE